MGLGIASVRYKETCEGVSEKKECRTASVTGALSEPDNGHIRKKNKSYIILSQFSVPMKEAGTKENGNRARDLRHCKPRQGK